MEKYSASMKQSPEKIRRYSEVLFNIFYAKIKILGMILSVVFVLLGGFVVKSEGLSLVVIFLGCILFTNLNAPSRYIANRVIALFRGSYPTLNYSFFENRMELKDSMILYSELIQLVEDEEYYYLFQSSQFGWMLPKNSVKGEKNKFEFRDFISKKTGLKWRRPPTILNLNLDTLRRAWKKNSNYEGQRLGK